MGIHRDALGRAALGVLADDGSRGLTHRSVDRRAQVSEGTTSRYARTRTALLELAAEALFAADRHAAATAWGSAATVDDVVDGLIRATATLLKAPERYRARLELQLEAHRAPEIQRHFTTGRATFAQGLAEALETAGEPDAPHTADVLIAVLDGVLHRHVILGRPALSPSRLRDLLVAIAVARNVPPESPAPVRIDVAVDSTRTSGA